MVIDLIHSRCILPKLFPLLFLCGWLVSCTAPPPTAPLPTMTRPAPTLIPVESPTGPPTMPAVLTPTETAAPLSERTIRIPHLPTPEQSLGGGTVQDGLFTFDLRLYRDPRLSANPVAPSLYSDLEGIGIYAVWGYQGPGLSAPVTVSWGVEPDVEELLQQAQYIQDGVQAGDGDGRNGGILLPAGSQAGDVVRAILKIETAQKTYGAVMGFTLKEGGQGLEPADISVQPLEANQEP